MPWDMVVLSLQLKTIRVMLFRFWGKNNFKLKSSRRYKDILIAFLFVKRKEKCKFIFSRNPNFFLKGGLGHFETTLSYLMLVWLPLSHSRLTKELVAVCIETLKTNSTITEVFLNGGNIDDAIAAELTVMLKENSTLTSLDLAIIFK